MVNKSKRGTKLKCQNEDCALPFYDLNVDQPDCPTCGTGYDHEASKELVGAASSHHRRRQAPVFEIVAPEEPIETTSPTDDDGASDQILDIDDDETVDTSDRAEGSLAN
ncbi:MAG: FYDLN acid domain-containing protein [Hyphomicrobiaceae bacterium]